MSERRAEVARTTRETEVSVDLDLDGGGEATIDTGIGMLDHMLATLALFAGWRLTLRCTGDLRVDDHHTAEDCAISLGDALARALGDRHGLARFGSALAPLDEALARAVVDLSGRPWPEIHLDLQRPSVGDMACENITHFFRSLAVSARAAIHVDMLRGENDHHRIEAAFKALALALAEATQPRADRMPSTKGVL
jgi:imidazoleglycerol phosphate dehydratase HisB